jgi:predicted flap endonuclease-1-like 5' DNA nuclease
MADLVLGPSGGNGGHEFDQYLIPPGARLREIRVNAGLYVDGLQFVCEDASGAVIELPHLGGKGGFHHTITLDPDEYLVGISGRSGRYVDSIRFHTSKRTTDQIGGPSGGDTYHFEAAPNGEVGGLFGRADWFIDKIGIIVRDRAITAGTHAGTLAASVPISSGTAPAAGVSAEVVAAPATKTTRSKKAVPVAAEAAAPVSEAAPKPAAKSRKKTAATDLVGIPDSAPVAPPAPDLVAIPDSGPVTPSAPDLVGLPDSGPVTPETPVLVGIPGSDTVAATGLTPVVDDLTKIEGIGPKIAQLLADAGITTFAALAATSVERLREILAAGGSRYRLTDPGTWPEQASHAASGDWDSFNALVARLKAGRRA